MDEASRVKYPASALVTRGVTRSARKQQGEQLRKAVPRSSHGAWSEPTGRADPVALLDAQNATRLPDLVPIRLGRMLDSPFAFYRGSAVVMAADLAGTPTTAIEVQACGDAHLANFGLYGSPERHLVFDLNDFDETLPGPWEWDVKRLAASAVLAAREKCFSEETARSCAMAGAESYRQAMANFSQMSTLETWYWHIDVDEQLRDASSLVVRGRAKKDLDRARKAADKAHSRDTLQALSKLTEVVDGRRRIVSDPPLVVPAAEGSLPDVSCTFDCYLDSLATDRRVLLERFTFVDLARKVVGVGSVGTRCWIMLLEGGGDDDPLFLQVKEAEASVLERYWRPSGCTNHAERVVMGQRLMQAETDIFLGWTRMQTSGVDYYVRQLRDMKGSVDLATINARLLRAYTRLCGAVLARAHARSGDASMITGYLGSSDAFDRALADFAVAYADQSERDHSRLKKAATKGRVPVERGI